MPKTISFNSAEGLRQCLATLGKEATAELRVAAYDLAEEIANEAAQEATSQGGLAALIAPSITGRKDRVPTVKMGSAKKLPEFATTDQGGYTQRSRKGANQTIGAAMWGAEFGGQRRPTTQQFRPWRGSGNSAGYFLYPTVRAMSDQMQARYSDAIVEAIDNAARKTKSKGAKRGR